MLSVNKQLFEKIQSVVLAGFNVLILEGDIFVFTKFEASTSSNVSSVDFNEVVCLCITDFLLNTQISELTNAVVFQRKLRDKIDSLGAPIKMRFSKYIPYLQYLT